MSIAQQNEINALKSRADSHEIAIQLLLKQVDALSSNLKRVEVLNKPPRKSK